MGMSFSLIVVATVLIFDLRSPLAANPTRPDSSSQLLYSRSSKLLSHEFTCRSASCSQFVTTATSRVALRSMISSLFLGRNTFSRQRIVLHSPLYYYIRVSCFGSCKIIAL